jgi:hypothetical protein
VKFETTLRFANDFKALRPEHRRAFQALMPAFNAACDHHRSNPAALWPKRLRVSQMRDAKGIWEMTWSFSGPDGRATFEFIEIDDETLLRWRRIGDHDIYKEP